MSVPIAKQYIKDFEQLGFGVFVHFGLYSILERGEWAANDLEIPYEEYRKLMDKFVVDDLRPMVAEIKKSGAKYITLTTRHHDGFSLYDTCGLNDFDAPHSAAGRDLVKEFVDACREYDIVPFLYHTTIEWYHPDFHNDFDKYLKYTRDSVEILCKNYGKIGGLWFDGNWEKKGADWKEDELYGMIRKYQPEAMIINNTGMSARGAVGHPEIDSVTYERGKATPINREGAPKYVSAEVCDSINMHWGIAQDINYKSPKAIIEALCRSRCAGANYLFNVGPDKNGHIPLYPKATLEVLGHWMGLFGEAIYDGRPFWYNENMDNFVLKSDKHAYFFCFNVRREGNEHVALIEGSNRVCSFKDFNLKVDNIHWMDNDEKLNFAYEGDDLLVHFHGYDYGLDYCVRVAKADIVE